MKKAVLFAVLVTAALGCSSSSSSDPNLDAWTREVAVIKPSQIGDRQYEEIAGLEEQERIRNLGNQPGVQNTGDDQQAISSATNRLRRRAAELDADAVVIVACGRNVRPSEYNPSPLDEAMVVCHGVAIRWLDN